MLCTRFSKISLLLAVLGCFSSLIAAQEREIDLKVALLNMQIEEVNSSFQDRDKQLYLKYGGNERLSEFLQENSIDSTNQSEFNGMVQALTMNNAVQIFNKRQVLDFQNQLRSSDEEIIYLITIPDEDRFSFLPVEKFRKNYEIGVPLLTGIEFYTLSEPIFTFDKHFCLINHTQGALGSMTGGVKVYRKENGKYVPYTIIDTWME